MQFNILLIGSCAHNLLKGPTIASYKFIACICYVINVDYPRTEEKTYKVNSCIFSFNCCFTLAKSPFTRARFVCASVSSLFNCRFANVISSTFPLRCNNCSSISLFLASGPSWNNIKTWGIYIHTRQSLCSVEMNMILM